MVEAAGGATWAPVAAALTTTAVWAGALATTATAAAVDSGSISAVTVTVAPTAKKPTAARAAPTLKAAHSRKLAVQESGAFSDPDSFLCPYSPECVEGGFSEVRRLRVLRGFARMPGREAGPRLGGGTHRTSGRTFFI